MNTENTYLDKFNNWMKNSLSLKLISITILVLLLLIPSSMIKNIITEREMLNQSTTLEVSEQWSDRQTICGPVFTVPAIFEHKTVEKVDGELVEITKEYTRKIHILPESLKVNGDISPNELHRGIYKVIVYQSDLKFKGSFNFKDTAKMNGIKRFEWDKSYLTIGISDLRGIDNQITVKWGNKKLPVEPGVNIPSIIHSGITVDLDGFKGDKTMDFEFDIILQGSKNLSFVPLGSTTDVQLASEWESPSFNGKFLPDTREISDTGFIANWNILELNRNFPQYWEGSDNGDLLRNASFGVDLIRPLDDYQKSMRSAKYAIMTIALTFLIFFLVEIFNKKRIHPFQYILVGLALCLFYILLVSLTEHISYDKAYGVSGLIVVVLISLYSLNVFKQMRLSIMLAIILSGIYGFLFVIIQMADYSLLMGSIGLTFILAILMYSTRKIDWYNIKRKPIAE